MAEAPPMSPPPVPVPATPTALVPLQPTTYRERLAQFKILEEKRFELIEELLEKLEKAEAKLTQTELDLQSEQNVRRTLQAEVVEAKERETALAQKQARRPFVLVLIDADADGFLFQDKYITRRAQGGEQLADELLIRIREYLRPQFEDADSLDILVRVYANLEGMANYLVREGKVRNLGQLRAFSTGFSGRIPSFDWIDIGVGKEGGSGRKVRESLSFYTSSTHLRHVVLACSPAELPASLLSTLPLEKITLLETLPLPTALTTLPIQITRLPTIFTPPPPAKSPVPIRGRSKGAQLQLSQQEDPDGGATWLVIKPERSRSQAGGMRRGGRSNHHGSEDDDSSLSISIGPDNTVSVDSGRRRRVMG
ncbi:hypothetical protein BU24DRAFT_421056 [Aaosphaeria arxii CBS 175.79]|uniref:DUF7923 domain-containing protein n=1 Tax=Aaosphaeria arxii CBS 175.79 TaxID=1450172 RepID=A0A6A5XYN8_9PLEO|nr:uncharacterized protein BU24DRAFT_421056 [Aaosphaeria arxii CBS 175.79]KAF2018043.1 hypothetical protein BU24DRAFT_421056 [Aaosphaeria arxii CBS 175.79]